MYFRHLIFFTFIIYLFNVNNVIFGGLSCRRLTKAFGYFGSDELVDIVISINKPKNLGDVYRDFFYQYIDRPSDIEHLNFYYNEITGKFSQMMDLYKDPVNERDEKYLMTLEYLVNKTANFNLGNCEFYIRDGDGNLIVYYLLKKGDRRFVFEKLTKNTTGDILFSDSNNNFQIEKDYKKISIKFNPAGIGFNSVTVYNIFFGGTKKVLRVEVRKVRVQHYASFIINVKISYDGNVISNKDAKNGSECSFNITL